MIDGRGAGRPRSNDELKPEMPADTMPADTTEQLDRSQVAQAVQTVWAQLLGQASYRAGATWAGSGADSFATVEMLLALERHLKSSIPADVIAEDMTPVALTDRIWDRLTGRVSEARSLPRLFVLPALAPKDLAVAQFIPSLDGHFAPVLLDYGRDEWLYDPGNFPAVVARLEREIREAAPSEAIHLLGHSWGCGIAVELASRLSAAGAEVGFVGLLDERPFGVSPTKLGGRIPLRIRILWLLRRHFESRKTKRAIAFDYFSDLMVLLGLENVLVSTLWLFRRVLSFNKFRSAGYSVARLIVPLRMKTPPYAGRVWLFRTSGRELLRDWQPADLGWRRFCRHVTVIPIVGDHGGMLMSPYRDGLARQLLSATDQALITFDPARPSIASSIEPRPACGDGTSPTP